VSLLLARGTLQQHLYCTFAGASNGIGAALALRYARPGVVLGLTGRDASRLEAVAEACTEKGAHVHARTVDVSDRGAMADFMMKVRAHRPSLLA